MRGSANLYNHVVIGYPLQLTAICGEYLFREGSPGICRSSYHGTRVVMIWNLNLLATGGFWLDAWLGVPGEIWSWWPSKFLSSLN